MVRPSRGYRSNRVPWFTWIKEAERLAIEKKNPAIEIRQSVLAFAPESVAFIKVEFNFYVNVNGGCFWIIGYNVFMLGIEYNVYFTD